MKVQAHISEVQEEAPRPMPTSDSPSGT